jgi:hypothetical protein
MKSLRLRWVSLLNSILPQDLRLMFLSYLSLVHARTPHCLDIPSDYKIVETNAFEIGFRGILKQLVSPGSSEQIVRFHYGSWNSAQYNYSIIKKFFLLLKNIASKQIFEYF